MFPPYVPTSWGRVKKTGTKFLNKLFLNVPTSWRHVKKYLNFKFPGKWMLNLQEGGRLDAKRHFVIWAKGLDGIWPVGLTHGGGRLSIHFPREFESQICSFRMLHLGKLPNWSEMGPYGSIWAHMKTGQNHMAQDHFQTPLDPQRLWKIQNVQNNPKRLLTLSRLQYLQCVDLCLTVFDCVDQNSYMLDSYICLACYSALCLYAQCSIAGSTADWGAKNSVHVFVQRSFFTPQVVWLIWLGHTLPIKSFLTQKLSTAISAALEEGQRIFAHYNVDIEGHGKRGKADWEGLRNILWITSLLVDAAPDIEIEGPTKDMATLCAYNTWVPIDGSSINIQSYSLYYLQAMLSHLRRIRREPARKVQITTKSGKFPKGWRL